MQGKGLKDVVWFSHLFIFIHVFQSLQ